MGWLFSNAWCSPKAVRESLNQERGNLTIVAQKATTYGRHLWTLYETQTGERFINLDLMSRDGEYGWGYKDMDESMGPYYYDCPLELLDQAGPTPHETAQRWREKVRAMHARKARKLEVGTKIQMYGNTYTVVETGRRKIIRREDGRVFRLSRRNLEALEVVG